MNPITSVHIQYTSPYDRLAIIYRHGKASPNLHIPTTASLDRLHRACEARALAGDFEWTALDFEAHFWRIASETSVQMLRKGEPI